MPKYLAYIYRTQRFVTTINAEDEGDAAEQLTSDCDMVDELVHDHPYNVSNGEWMIDSIENVHTL